MINCAVYTSHDMCAGYRRQMAKLEDILMNLETKNIVNESSEVHNSESHDYVDKTHTHHREILHGKEIMGSKFVHGRNINQGTQEFKVLLLI